MVGSLSFLAVILLFFIYAGSGNDAEKKTVPPSDNEFVIHSVVLPEELDFAGERVPLENFDVRESLDREILINTYWQSHTLLLIKRANRYFPVIEQILLKNGIPGDFKYLPVVESDLMNAVSPSQAVGFWQFLKGTARDYGLEVNDEVDERYHVEKATEAACRFIKDSYERYGTWTMAAASYNQGRTGLNKQIERQKTKYYYDLLLNEETSRYIYRVLALKLIMSNPDEYGFIIDREDMYPVIPTYEVTVDTPVEDMADFAAKYSINYKILKYFNPWLRDNKLTNGHAKTYYIKIPKKGYRNFIVPIPDTIR